MKQLQSVAAMGLVLLVAGPTMAQDLLWVEQFGTPYTDTATATAVDAADHVYVAGITHGALAPDVSERPRCQQAFLQKRDADGNVIWTRQFGSDWADTLRSVVVDAEGNVLVTGLTVEIPFHLGSCNGPGDAWVRKFDADGNELWERRFGTTTYDGARSVAVDSEQNVWVGGWTAGVLPGQTSAGSQDAFIRKYDPDGNEILTVQYGTAGSEPAAGVVVDGSDNVYAVGWTDGIFPGETSAGGWDAYVSKFDADGNALWTHQFGSSATDSGRAITVDPFDDVWVVGDSMGDVFAPSAGWTDIFMLKLDPAGNQLAGVQFGGPSFESAQQGEVVTTDALGNVWTIGSTQGALPGQTQIGSHDLFLTVHDREGEELFLQQFGTVELDWAGAIATGPTGSVYLSGQTYGSLPGHTNAGVPDAMVIRVESLLEGQEAIIELLIEAVIEVGLPGNAGQAQLNAALEALREDPPDIAATITALEDFINFVEAQRGKKIPVKDADLLIEGALAVIEALGG